jgi:dienelactone hydrolase
MLNRRQFVAAAAVAACPVCRGDAADANPAKTLNDYFPFAVPKTIADWQDRAAFVRTQVRVACGIYPEPVKTPLQAVVHGKVARDGYTVEKVFFQSVPGHTVCGNLYRPANANPKCPAVLFAHGHWENGRLHEVPAGSARAMVQRGEEADEPQARRFMQAIPITLARRGYVVFQYDMVGYADSTSIGHVARSGVPHPNGFADAAGELHLQSLFGLQTWNGVRALDFLTSLPDVDAGKIGMTGASGGGTQTFILAAIDDRIATAVPAVMVSTAMQGGCVCENTSLLRVRTGNIELAGLIAPRPLALTGANDWTKEIETKGYPELKQLYTLLGKPENVSAKAWPQFPHNFNKPAREYMYAWFDRHLMGKAEAAPEPKFEPVDPQRLRVFDPEHPRPAGERDAAGLRKEWLDAGAQQLNALPEKDRDETVRAALAAMVCDRLPKTIAIHTGPLESKVGEYTCHKAILGRTDEADALACTGLIGKAFRGGTLCIWLTPAGKDGIVKDGDAIDDIKPLLAAGVAVVSCDIHGTGASGAEPKVNPVYAGFTFGYNRSFIAERAHDILTAIAFGTSVLKVKTISVVGRGALGIPAVLAAGLAGSAVAKLAADLNGFRFENVKTAADPMMLPGALKYGGLPAFLRLCGPRPAMVWNHAGTGTGKTTESAFPNATLTRRPGATTAADITNWLLG